MYPWPHVNPPLKTMLEVVICVWVFLFVLWSFWAARVLWNHCRIPKPRREMQTPLAESGAV